MLSVGLMLPDLILLLYTAQVLTEVWTDLSLKAYPLGERWSSSIAYAQWS